MGGLGSGEFVRENLCKKRVEDCRSIDSFALAKTATAGASGYILRWPCGSGEMLSVLTKRVRAGWVLWAGVLDRDLPDTDLWAAIQELGKQSTDYELTAVDLDPEAKAAIAQWSLGRHYTFEFAIVFAPQIAEIESTVSGAGARCEWFRCPAFSHSEQCGQRCRKLYWLNGRFACRQCHDLAYISQRESRADRLIRKAEKIRQRVLGALPDTDAAPWREHTSLFPPHPPQMTLRRYDQLYDQWSQTLAEAHELVIGRLNRDADRMLEKLGVGEMPESVSKIRTG